MKTKGTMELALEEYNKYRYSLVMKKLEKLK